MAGMLMKVACVVVALVVVAAPFSEAITCGQVVNFIVPCLGYLKSGGPVPPACCNGVKGLNSAARTTADRRQACTCLKNAYAAFSGINTGNSISLPGKCGVNLPFKTSPDIDCNKVQ